MAREYETEQYAGWSVYMERGRAGGERAPVACRQTTGGGMVESWWEPCTREGPTLPRLTNRECDD